MLTLYRRLLNLLTRRGYKADLLLLSHTPLGEEALRFKHRFERSITTLQQMAEDMERKVVFLRAKAAEEERHGNADMAAQLRVEVDRYTETLKAVEAQHKGAAELAERIKAAVKLEDGVQKWMAEGLVLRTHFKAAQIEQTISRRLTQIKASNQGASGEEGRATHEQNHNILVEALKARNELEQMVKDSVRKVDMLQAKAELAQQRGDADLERQLLREKESYEAVLQVMQSALNRAERMTAPATALWREEDARLAALPPTPASDASTTETDGESAPTNH